MLAEVESFLLALATKGLCIWICTVLYTININDDWLKKVRSRCPGFHLTSSGIRTSVVEFSYTVHSRCGGTLSTHLFKAESNSDTTSCCHPSPVSPIWVLDFVVEYNARSATDKISCSRPMHVINNIFEGLSAGWAKQIVPSAFSIMYSSSHSAGRSASKLLCVRHYLISTHKTLTLRHDTQKGALRTRISIGLSQRDTFQACQSLVHEEGMNQHTRRLASSPLLLWSPGIPAVFFDVYLTRDRIVIQDWEKSMSLAVLKFRLHIS